MRQRWVTGTANGKRKEDTGISLWMTTWTGGSSVSELLKKKKTKARGHVHSQAGNGELWVWVKRNLVPTEQKVHSQGRMLGYLFFSLLSSLLASSYVPWALPPGKDYRTELQLDPTPPILKNSQAAFKLLVWIVFCCMHGLVTSSATYSKQSSIKSRELRLPLSVLTNCLKNITSVCVTWAMSHTLFD